MFDPELFHVTAFQYRDFASSLITTVLAFSFLYLLALPLKKIPFLDAIEDYEPPAWVLPVFSILLVLLFSFSTGVFAFLLVYRTHPDDRDFKKSFFKEKTILIDDLGMIQQSYIRIHSYNEEMGHDPNELNDFQLSVNGYRVFSSSSNCHMLFQCRPIHSLGFDERMQQYHDFQPFASYYASEKRAPESYSVHHLDEQFSLPYDAHFESLLTPGDNYIDITAYNSGNSLCYDDFSIVMKFDDKRKIEKRIIIRPLKSFYFTNPYVPRDFYASWVKASTPGYISVYRTLPSDQTMRLCERLRYVFHLNAYQLPLNLDDCDNAIKICRAAETDASPMTCPEAKVACRQVPPDRWLSQAAAQ